MAELGQLHRLTPVAAADVDDVQRAGGQMFEELAVDEVCPHDPA
jgi:hypothetical protein